MRAELKRLKRDTSSGRVRAASGSATTAAASSTAVAAAPSGTVALKSKTPLVALVVFLALAAAGAAVYFLKTRGPQFNLDKLKIEQVTTTGDATRVTISPDGRYIVYVRRDAGQQSLWMRQVESGGNVQILPPETVNFTGVKFSPDGAYLYFVRSDKGTANFNYLYQMPVLGGTPRQLGRDIDTPPAFSPDGKQIAYERGDPQKGRLEVLVANADGSGEKVLKELEDWGGALLPLAWSPDGKTIVIMFERQKGNERLGLLEGISSADGSVRELHRSEYPLGTSTWLPDGKGLLFVGRDSQQGKDQLWSLSFPDGEIRRFTNDLSRYDGDSLELTRDGKALVAVQWTTEANIFLAPEGDAARAKQINSGESNGFGVRWTPEGKLVTRNERGQLLLIDAAGQQSALIEEGPAGAISVCGDGKNVLYVKLRGSAFGIWRAGLDGSGASLLVDGARIPSCSPDGKWFTYFYQNGLWRMPVGGGKAQMLAENTGGPSLSSISPDGRFVVYALQEQDGNTFLLKDAVIAAEGGPVLHKITLPFGVSGSRWTPDGRGLHYVLRREGASNLWFQPLDGGPPKQITHFASGELFDYSWTKDGKQLALSRGRIRSDVVRISNFR
jgi:Tol biopolymer transport system component